MLLIVYFELVLSWILVFVMIESQDLDDWQLPSLQLLVDLDQPSASRWYIRDEAGVAKCNVQPQRYHVFHNFHCEFCNWKIRLW